jgi:hypothetical protein
MRTCSAVALTVLLSATLPALPARAQETPPAQKADESSPLGRPLTLAEVQAWTGRHPRLLFTAADVAALRERRNKPPYDRIFKVLLGRADRHLAIDPVDVGKARYQGRDQMSHILQRLAFAGLVTGDRKYSRKAVDLLAALGERGFPFHGTREDGAGDLMIGLALAYDWAYPAMKAAEASALRRQIKHFATALNALLSATGGAYGKMARRPGAAGHHVVALAGGGLGMVALSLRGEVNRDFTNAWQATADLCIHHYLRDAFWGDGAGIEGFDLTTYALHAALPYVIARRHMDKVDVAERTMLAQVPRWYAYELMPGPAMLPLGESGMKLGSEDALAAMFAAVPGDAVHAWFYEATHGARGRATFGTSEESFCAGDVATYLWYPGTPAALDVGTVLPLSKRFASRGVAFVRSGWQGGKDEVLVSFNCPSRGHLGRWQMDAGQVTLHAYGVGWATDSGYGWRTRGNKLTITPSGGSQGHNLMRVDGRHAKRPFGRMLAFLDDKDWTMAVGDGSDAFGLKLFRRAVAVGKRDGRARYIVIVDEIAPGDADEHEVVHFLHTDAGNTVDIAGRMAHITAANKTSAQFAVMWPRGVQLKVAPFETMAGRPHPRIEVSHRTAGAFTYVAVLVPQGEGEEKATITPVFGAPGAAAFTVKLGDVEDKVCILTRPGARPPEGFGRQKHRFQFTNGAFEKSLLLDLQEPGHDAPQDEDVSKPPAKP